VVTVTGAALAGTALIASGSAHAAARAPKSTTRHAGVVTGSIQVSPGDGTSDVRTDKPVTVSTGSGRIAAVTLRGPDGTSVPGRLNAAGTAWTTVANLATHAKYTVHTTVISPTGEVHKNTSKFSTFTPTQSVQTTTIAPEDNQTVGVGMPVSVQFASPIKNRAAVERALHVTAIPAVSGHWSWLSPTRVDYRPESFWRPGTIVSVALDLNGVNTGDDKYGTADQLFHFTIGRDQRTVVNLAAHQLNVFDNGKSVKQMPISAGMPGLDTWGGTMAVMDKAPSVAMNSETVGLGAAYDIPDVQWAIHLTTTGTYIHAAPWSVGAQGVANTSHGCVGLSTANAYWLFQRTIPGDVVEIEHSPKQVAPSNGYGDWQDSWSKWLAGSALPSTAE
jgi:lipoprotein-anchoring transpeptidase ErfK/SrfK